jgi:hypothetical protein
MQMPETPPRVFISYSHDSQEHKARVLALAQELRRNGVDARIDRYVPSPPEGWPLWCQVEIREAKFVLAVCTDSYKRRVDGEEASGKGLGVLWEATIIRQHLYKAGGVSNKIVPILFADESKADESEKWIPEPLKGYSHYRPDQPESYESLYRLLTNQPDIIPEILGSIRHLPPRRHLLPIRHLPPLAPQPVYEQAAESNTAGKAHVSEHSQVASPHVIHFLRAGEALQSRLYNILDRGGLYALKKQYPDGEYAEQILYMMAQYFASVDYLLYTPYGSDAEINELTRSIQKTFATNTFGTGPFCIFNPEQAELVRLVKGNSNEFEVKFFSEFRQALASPSKPIQDTLSALKSVSSMAELDEKYPNVRSRLAIVQGNLVDLLNYIESKEGMPPRTSAPDGIRLKAQSKHL